MKCKLINPFLPRCFWLRHYLHSNRKQTRQGLNPRHLPASRPHMSQLVSSSLTLLLCKMGLVVELTSCWEDQETSTSCMGLCTSWGREGRRAVGRMGGKREFSNMLCNVSTVTHHSVDRNPRFRQVNSLAQGHRAHKQQNCSKLQNALLSRLRVDIVGTWHVCAGAQDSHGR